MVGAVVLVFGAGLVLWGLDWLLQVVEPPFLRAVMQEYHGQCATAARQLGLHRTTLRKKLDQYGIEDA